MTRRSRLASPVDPDDPRAARRAGIALGFTAGAALGVVFGLLLESIAVGVGAGVVVGGTLALASLPRAS